MSAVLILRTAHLGRRLSHSQACVCYLRDFMLERLSDPATTRSGLKRKLAALAKQVEDARTAKGHSNLIVQRPTASISRNVVSGGMGMR